jgi:hypothetical protein
MGEDSKLDLNVLLVVIVVGNTAPSRVGRMLQTFFY